MSFDLTLPSNSPHQPPPLGRIGDDNRPDPRLVAECMRENRGRLLAAVSVVQAALATHKPKAAS